MSKSGSGSFECESSDEEDGHDDVGKEGREVDHLAGRLDPPHDDGENDHPSKNEA